MKYSEKARAGYIREKSNPTADQIEAIESNARLLDALYRLTFTADRLTAPQIDELINALQRKGNEVTVLLGRIKNVFEKGFSYDIFSDTEPQQVQVKSVKVVLQEKKRDKLNVFTATSSRRRKGGFERREEPVKGEEPTK